MDESRRKPLLDFLLSLLTLGFYDCWLLYAIPSDFSKAEGKKAIGSEEKAGNETKTSTEEKAGNGGRTKKALAFSFLFALLSVLYAVYGFYDVIYKNAGSILLITAVYFAACGLLFLLWVLIFLKKHVGIGRSILLCIPALFGLKIIGLCALEHSLSEQLEHFEK